LKRILAQFKLYFQLSLNLKMLYPYIIQKLIISFKALLRFDPPYEFEKKLSYDKITTKTIAEIEDNLKKSLLTKYTNGNMRWNDIVERTEVGNSISNQINTVFPLGKDPRFATQIESLIIKGISSFPDKKLCKNDIEEILQYLETKKVFPAHVAHTSVKKPCSINTLNNGINPFGSYDMQTILGSRVLAKVIGDEEIHSLIGNYFGCWPTLANVNLFWSFVRPNALQLGPQNFHRDADDFKQVNVFIPLTETGKNDGGYCHIKHSHNLQQLSENIDQNRINTLPEKLNPFGRPFTVADLFSLPVNGYGFTDLYENLLSKHVQSFFGPPGTIRCVDGYGLHRGVVPKKRDRLLFWASYTLTKAPTENLRIPYHKRIAYSKVRQGIKDTDINKYVLRKIIAFNQ